MQRADEREEEEKQRPGHIMKDYLQRAGVALGLAVILVHYFPFSGSTCLVFLLGIVCTLVLEVALLVKYLGKGDGKEGFLVVNKQLPEEPEPQTYTYIPQKASVDVRPCYCSSAEFHSLVAGKDLHVKQLVHLAESFISAERLYAQHLVRLGGSSLLDKITMRSAHFAPGSPWGRLKAVLNEFGEKRLQECESLQNGTCKYLLEVRKRVKSQMKDLRQAQLSEAQRFTSVATRLRKLNEKLTEAKEGEQAAQTAYEGSKTKLAAFSTLAKHEMKIKVAKNEQMTITAKVKEAQDELEREAEDYLGKLKRLVDQCKETNGTKTEAAKVTIQAWVEALQHLFTWEHSTWLKLTEDLDGSATPLADKPKRDSDLKTNITSWIAKTLNLQEETERLFFLREQETEGKKVLTAWGELHGFVTGVCDALDYYARELGKLALFEAKMNELGLSESWSRLIAFLEHISSITEESAKNIREVLLNCDTPRIGDKFQQLLTRAKEDSTSGLNTILQTEMQSLQEAQQKDSMELRAVLLRVLDQALTVSCEVLAGLEREVSETQQLELEFEPTDASHNEQCPYYRLAINTGLEEITPFEAGKAIGEPESAIWFNCLFSTFLKEWSESQRFLAYLCRRLKKVYNKDRPQFLGEISVPKVVLEGKPPEINKIVQLESEAGTFLHECDLWYKGGLEFYLDFEAHWTVASVQVAVKVVLRSIYGRVRVFFCPSAQGKSWYSFTAEPAYQVEIQPVLGRQNKVELGRFPQLNSVLSAVLARKFRKFVWPNRRSVKIPLARTKLVPS